MSSLDMSEAVKMLANEKNISVDTLLHVLVDALAVRGGQRNVRRATKRIQQRCHTSRRQQVVVAEELDRWRARRRRGHGEGPAIVGRESRRRGRPEHGPSEKVELRRGKDKTRVVQIPQTVVIGRRFPVA